MVKLNMIFMPLTSFNDFINLQFWKYLNLQPSHIETLHNMNIMLVFHMFKISTNSIIAIKGFVIFTL